MRIASVGHALFGITMIALGLHGLVDGTFVQPWQPVPKWVPARGVLSDITALVALGSGLGLLGGRAAPAASRVLFGSLLVWLLAFRLPNLFYEKPLVLVG